MNRLVLRSSTSAPALRLGAVAAALLSTAALTSTGAQAQLQPTIGPPVRIDVGGGEEAANETTVSVSEANPQEIVAGWNDWRLSTSFEIINSGFALSLDGGASWTDFLIRPPAANQSGVEGDPITAFDPRTGTLWAGAISFSAGSQSGIYVARKDPGASVFNPSVMARTTSGTDKPWMAAGPRPGMPDTTRLYIAYNEGVIWSDNMGATWTSPTSLGPGLGFLPRIGPDGELYVAYWNAGSEMKLKRSLNGGASFSTHTVAVRMDVWGTQDGSRFPGTFRTPSLLYLDINKSTGTLYAAYFDTTDVAGGNSNVDIYFTKSTDQGTSWTTPVALPIDAFPTGDQFFCWIEADKDGRLHMVYYDSRNTIQDDNDVNGMFDAYYAYSVNEGDTWGIHRLSPLSWNSDNDGLDRPSQFIGDYLGLSVAGNKAYPVYLDTINGDADIYTNIIEIPIVGDTNGDGTADFTDLIAILAGWGPCGIPTGCASDLNGDGITDFEDLIILLANWS